MQNGAKMAVRIIAGILVLALVAGLVVMAVSAAEETSFAAGESDYQLTENVDGVVIDHDLCLDLNGFQATNVTVNEGVALQLVDSANDQYEADKCGSLSGTINGTVEQLVKRDTKNYLVICQDGVYSAHRFYAGITDISLVPGTVSLGYKATFKADTVINALVTGYGYSLGVNDLKTKTYMKNSSIQEDVLTLRLKNILSENETLSQLGTTATIKGNAIITFTVNGEELTVTGADHNTTLRQAVEAVNEALGNNRNAYTATQVQAVQDFYNQYTRYMTDWQVEYIFTEDKFVPVENVTATYGETLTLGQVFTAVEGMTFGENVTVTVDGEGITVSENWADTALSLSAGEHVITITDNDRCWTATNTVVIAKADPSYELPTGLTATYGDTLADVALPEGFSWVDATASVGNAGTNSFAASYNAGENYNPVKVTLTVEVAKADITAPAVDTLNATYGQKLSEIALPEGFSWADATASVGNAGTNSFAAIYNAGENYNTVKVTVTVEVAKIDPTYTIPTGLEATDGDALSTITLPAGFAWVDGNETVTLEKTEYAATYYNGDANYNTVNVNIPVLVSPAEAAVEIECKMPEAAFTYRLGNINAVNITSLIKNSDDSAIDLSKLSVSVAAQNGHVVSGAYDAAKGELTFTGTGLVEITFTGDANSVSLTFEIVNAVNSTKAAHATANNVVLLNNVGFSTIEVKKGYTLFGNGFTMTCTSDLSYHSFKAAYVDMENGTLDNVRIVVPFFARSFLYNGNMTGDNSAYNSNSGSWYNCRSAVIMNGNSKIVNSYISGGRAAVYATSGNPVLENTTIVGGGVANIHVGNVSMLTLRNMTLIQKPIEGTVNGQQAKTIMGFSVIIECDANGASAPVTLEGYLDQFAWVNSSYSQYIAVDNATTVIDKVMEQTKFQHNISVDGVADEKWLNLGIAYWPAGLGLTVNTPTIYDNRTNKTDVPYEGASVGAMGTSAYVYSILNTNAKDVDTPTEPEITANAATIPQVAFNDLGTGKTFATAYDASTYGWMSTLTVDLDTTGDYTFKFSDLVVSKYGHGLNYTVTDANGATVSDTVTLDDSGVKTYTLHITDNVDCNGSTTVDYTFELIATKTSIRIPVKVTDPNGTALLVVKSKDSDWSCALPALEGAQIEYYNKTNKAYETLALSSLTPSSTGKQNGTENFWTYSDPNGNFTLKVTCGVIHDTKSVYGMPVVVNNSGNKLYFTISSTTGYVSSGTAARSVTLTYEFTDANGQTISFTKNWYCNRQSMIDAGAKQYSYSDFCNGTLTEVSGGSSGCVTPDTLVTLADGTQVRVDSLTGAEELLVWNMETGKLDAAPIMFVDAEAAEQTNVVTLCFSDGTDVKVVYEHGFWDYDLNRYVYLDEEAADYIGHTFAKQNGETLSKVQLVDVVIESQITEAWSPVTAGHLCYFVNGMLSMPGGVGGLFNIFDVNPETMTYDYEAMARDIETYGLFTYEEMNSIVGLPVEMFEAAGGAFLKISMGKGNLTMDELIAMIVRYTKYF